MWRAKVKKSLLALALLPLFAGAALAEAGPAALDGRPVTLGWGRIFDNDALGDGRDRWRTGAYTVSLIRGTEFSGKLPSRLGDLLEWRLHTEILAPANLAAPKANDRRYAGVLSLGLHAQSDWQGLEVALGADLVGLGPMTGVAQVQTWVHNALDIDEPNTKNQLPNRIVPTVSAEIARNLDLGPLRLRPFAGASVGIENLLRAGFDVTLGAFGRDAVMVRDTGTGQRYRAAPSGLVPGFSLVAGGDVARVYGSQLLPEGGVAHEPERRRLRAGIHWQGQRASAFYGLTWLSREFIGQSEDQVLGSLSVNLRF